MKKEIGKITAAKFKENEVVMASGSGFSMSNGCLGSALKQARSQSTRELLIVMPLSMALMKVLQQLYQ
jgi:hypothetical protein